ncbi:hypothetical protein N7512_002962 [Penicillium capsulatum]|nr:hypothetical protein N7512_002962 [Penicillium capsulatum]
MDWDPSRFFRGSGSPSPYALLVLHQPINERAFEELGEHASFIICADGGGNRLYDMMKTRGKESSKLPDTILGDLDSLRPAVRQHYEDLGVSIIKDPDQYSTDFTKCLNYLNDHTAEIIASPRNPAGQQENKRPSHSPPDTPLDVVILGGLGGRVDQAFSQIHHLYMMTQTQREPREATDANTKNIQDRIASQRPKTGSIGNLYLVSEESITFVLQKGKNVIHTPGTRRPDIKCSSPKDSRPEGESPRKRKRDGPEPELFFEQNIGIIPLAGPASITTHGFEWDVQDWHTAIGGQLSTSNHIRAEQVEVEASEPVLFTVELAARLKRR